MVQIALRSRTVPDLNFAIESSEPVPFAAVPILAFRIAVSNAIAAESIYNVALRCQIQIESPRRSYSEGDQSRLSDLFGEPSRWSQTLRNMLWTNAAATIPAFQDSTQIDLQVPCTFDFNVAATKYFHGIESGDIPLNFLFSGTIFYDAGDGTPRISPIAWSKEARFLLPVSTWRSLMDTYYPNTAWLCLRRDTFERLYEFKTRHGIPTWEAALDLLLPVSEEVLKS
jgi:hypothetical protein